MAMTEAIQEEWNKHQSRFARGWRTSMVARKKVEFVEVAPHLTLEKRIARAVVDTHLAAIIDKDRRLIEAALVTEERVISLDDHVRRHLQDHVAAVTRSAIDLLGQSVHAGRAGHRLARGGHAGRAGSDARVRATEGEGMRATVRHFCLWTHPIRRWPFFEVDPDACGQHAEDAHHPPEGTATPVGRRHVEPSGERGLIGSLVVLPIPDHPLPKFLVGTAGRFGIGMGCRIGSDAPGSAERLDRRQEPRFELSGSP